MNCTHCGANLSLEDMTRPDCPYCKNVLKHHAQAAEHAALLNRMLDDRLRAQYPGLPPGATPQVGYGYGAPLKNMDQFYAHQANHAIKRAGWITAVAVIVPIMVVVLIGVFAAFALIVLR
jgi:hypothetical protein